MNDKTRKRTTLPGRCNWCCRRYDKVVFVGDSWGAMIAQNPCRDCGGPVYADLDDDLDTAIADSCRTEE